MSEPNDVQAERDALIHELEHRTKRRRFGVRWPTALFAISMAVLFFTWMRLDRDLLYFFSDAEPITLGTEGDYHFDRLRTNRYAQVHGVPTTRGQFFRDGKRVYVLVGLQNTPLLVQREPLPNEDWPENRPASPIDQRPFGIRGRLVREDDAPPQLKRGIDAQRESTGIVPRDGKLWVLIGDQKPGSDASPLVISGLLTAFVILNLWFLLRDLAARRRPTAGS